MSRRSRNWGAAHRHEQSMRGARRAGRSDDTRPAWAVDLADAVIQHGDVDMILGERMVADAYRFDLDDPTDTQLERAENELFQLPGTRVSHADPYEPVTASDTTEE